MFTFWRRTLINCFIFLAASVIFIACSDEKTTNPSETAPTMPPQSSMVIEFDEFPDTTGPTAPQNINSTYNNWGWAAANVAVWNAVLTVTLAVPVAAFREAFNHEPVLQPDGSWLWSYTVSVGGINHTAKLFGKTIEAGTEWTMLLSKEGVYTDFEWFTGISNLPVTEGTWTLYKSPENAVQFLFIEWVRNTQQNTAEIKYKNIVPGVPENGSFIHYGKTNSTPHNRFYRIFSQEYSNTTDIEWSYESHFGRVNDPLHFLNSDWHCWDELLMDTTCP